MMNDVRSVAQMSIDTKSAIGGIRMSEPAVAAGNPISSARIVGGAAIALAVSGFVQNAVFGGTAAPAYSDPLGVVLTYHAEKVSGSLTILAGPANLAIAGGSPLIFVGVVGYFLWLIWLVVIGIRLIRG
ncbi:MAG: hypothetical protein Fur005_46260 [Roseiflexaceae bacterium]